MANPTDPSVPVTLHETERGNIWLADDDGNHNAWIKLPGENQWLEISIRPDNYPGLNVNTVTVSKSDLATHINSNFEGWTVRKLNLKGVALDDQWCIVIPDKQGEPECPKLSP